jgi:hypothetical protein
MANANAPHGMQPVQTGDGNPYTGKGTLYHIQSTDTLAYYVGDIMQMVPAAGANGSTHGSDALGVPNVTGFAAGAVTTYAGAFIGTITGVQVAPIGAGNGNTQSQAVNLNISFVPATKLNDYYVWIADDPSLTFEMQSDATVLANATTVGMNAGFTVAAPANANGPLSGTVLTGASLAVTQTLPLKVVGVPYRPNIVLVSNYVPLLVRWNEHFFLSNTGITPGV